MGVYTEIAKLGMRTWDTRRWMGGSRGAADAPTPPFAETRYFCASCEEGYPFDSPCPRCGSAPLDRARAVPLPHYTTGRERITRGSWLMVGLVAFLAFGIPAFLIAAASNFASRTWLQDLLAGGHAAEAPIFVLAGLVAIAAPFVGSRVLRAIRTRRDTTWRKRLRSLLAHVPVLRAASLPDEAVEDVHIRGRVRIEPGASPVRVRVVDETGRVSLRVGPGVRAFRDDDTAQELYTLEDGDEVDVIGRGRRHVAAREEYREIDQELELEPVDDAPLHVWVRRRG